MVLNWRRKKIAKKKKRRKKHLDRNCVKNKSLSYSLCMSLVTTPIHRNYGVKWKISSKVSSITTAAKAAASNALLWRYYFLLWLKCFSHVTKNRIVHLCMDMRRRNEIDGKIADIARVLCEWVFVFVCIIKR